MAGAPNSTDWSRLADQRGPPFSCLSLWTRLHSLGRSDPQLQEKRSAHVHAMECMDGRTCSQKCKNCCYAASRVHTQHNAECCMRCWALTQTKEHTYVLCRVECHEVEAQKPHRWRGMPPTVQIGPGWLTREDHLPSVTLGQSTQFRARTAIKRAILRLL